MLLQMAPSLRCGTGTSAPFLAYRRRNEQTRTRLPHNHRTKVSFISPSPPRLSRLWPRVSYRNLPPSCGPSSSLCDSSCRPRPEKKRRLGSVKDFVMTKALLWEAIQLLKRRRLCEANVAARRVSLAIAAVLSFAFAAWKCKAVYAAETLPVALIPSMKAMWPKTSQVLGVMRSQGLIIVLLLALSAFFSMAETSITTLWPWKVQELAAKDPEDGVFRLLSQDVTRFLTTILIGTTVVNIAATALVTEAATTLFGEAGISAATGVMTVVVLLLTEITPKSIAVHNSIEVARIVVRPVAWLSVVLYPVGRIVTALSMGMLKILGLKSRSEQTVTEEELKLMLRGANLGGIIEDDQQDMIENVLDFKETHVREIMTPLIDVVAIDSRATLMEFRNLWETHQYSRIPVYESRIDNIVGIAYAMDMLDYVDQVDMLQKLTVGGIAHKPAYFIPDSMSVWNLLREFRIRKVHMAVVLNEYGGTIGIATLEDVVEEIVGEIFDESDSKEEIRKKTGYIVERAPGVYDVDANTAIEHFAEEINVKLEEGSYETVSGYVCEAFGYIPRTGESINVVLKKEIQEDGKDFADNDADHHEDQRMKNQKYKLEILSGNAKKVGSVRFEEISGGNVKSKKETQFTPRISKQLWENDTEVTDLEEQTTSVAPLVVAQNKEIPPKAFPNPHAMSERIKSDNDMEAKIVDISQSDMTVIGSEDSHLNIVKEAEFHAVHSDFSDVTSDSSIRDSDEDSKEQEKKIRKRKRRRKRPNEGIFTVEDQRSVNVQNESTK